MSHFIYAIAMINDRQYLPYIKVNTGFFVVS